MQVFRRIANFFIVISVFLIFLFIYSDILAAPYYRYLVFGILAALAGIALRILVPAPPPPSTPPSERFRLLKKNKDSKH